MQQIILETSIVSLTSLIITLIIIPVLSAFSVRLGLIDKPNHRKLHAKPVPVIGGIAIVISTIAALFLIKTSLQLIYQHSVIVTGSLLLFFVGVWDDRYNVRPLYRLILQFMVATAIATSGVRLTSLYGILGIDYLNTFWQYILTVLIITGVTNAFNLMDGIDGLAGGLALINLLILAVLSIILQQYAIFILLIALSSAIVGFLRSNIHPAKIFMGDGGSLMLGFLMSSIGILLIETSKTISLTIVDTHDVVLMVSTILVIPVFDSLRVYMRRIQRGDSPFKADKTHLHHLFLIFGLNHKKTAILIYALEILILTLGTLLNYFASISLSIVIIIALFLFISQLLELNSGVEKWKKIIHEMENSI